MMDEFRNEIGRESGLSVDEDWNGQMSKAPRTFGNKTRAFALMRVWHVR